MFPTRHVSTRHVSTRHVSTRRRKVPSRGGSELQTFGVVLDVFALSACDRLPVGAQDTANTTMAALAGGQRWRAVADVAGEVENALRVQISYPWRYMGYTDRRHLR